MALMTDSQERPGIRKDAALRCVEPMTRTVASNAGTRRLQALQPGAPHRSVRAGVRAPGHQTGHKTLWRYLITWAQGLENPESFPAERRGFEPLVPLRAHLISNQTPSATRSSLHRATCGIMGVSVKAQRKAQRAGPKAPRPKRPPLALRPRRPGRKSERLPRGPFGPLEEAASLATLAR